LKIFFISKLLVLIYMKKQVLPHTWKPCIFPNEKNIKNSVILLFLDNLHNGGGGGDNQIRAKKRKFRAFFVKYENF